MGNKVTNRRASGRASWRIWAAFAAIALVLTALYGARRIASDHVASKLVAHLWQDLWTAQKGDGLMLGSSSMAMLDVKRHLSCGDWVNRGIGSSLVDDMISYVEWSPSSTRPKRVLIYAGENDLARKMPVATVTAKYDQLLGALRNRYGDVEIQLLPIKFSPRRSRAHQDFIAFNGWLRARASTDPNLTYLGTALSEPSAADLPGAFRADGVHLTDAGYEIFLRPFNAACRKIARPARPPAAIIR